MREPRARQVGRLTKRPDFVAAASGRRFHTERMTVQGRIREEDGQGLRVGLTVTKKVGHAPERNRIKRRLRNAVRMAATEFLDCRTDIVVIGRRDILTADYRLLIDDLRRALRVVTKPKDPNSKSIRPAKPPSSIDSERRGTSHA
jgi:ribonuclease P protein component